MDAPQVATSSAEPAKAVARHCVLALAAGIFAILGLAARADAYVYWTNHDTQSIARANLDGTGVDQSFVGGLASANGVAVDDNHIYWTYFGTDTVGRANLDGTGVDPGFITAP